MEYVNRLLSRTHCLIFVYFSIRKHFRYNRMALDLVAKYSIPKFGKMIIPKNHNYHNQNMPKSGLLFRKNFLRTGITNIFNLNTIYGDE